MIFRLSLSRPPRPCRPPIATVFHSTGGAPEFQMLPASCDRLASGSSLKVRGLSPSRMHPSRPPTAALARRLEAPIPAFRLPVERTMPSRPPALLPMTVQIQSPVCMRTRSGRQIQNPCRDLDFRPGAQEGCQVVVDQRFKRTPVAPIRVTATNWWPSVALTDQFRRNSVRRVVPEPPRHASCAATRKRVEGITPLGFTFSSVRPALRAAATV